MKKVAAFGASLVLIVIALASGASSAGPATVLKADTLVGVSGPYVGSTNPIRGINGGGLPWSISAGKAVLGADGSLVVKVEGLVLTATGVNPIANFRGVVSCQTISSDGLAVTENVSTELFTATMTGDSKIEARVALPDPCFAPIVFVTSPTSAWFAVTGL